MPITKRHTIIDGCDVIIPLVARLLPKLLPCRLHCRQIKICLSSARFDSQYIKFVHLSLSLSLSLILLLRYTVKNICRFYGKITGNQLPVHFPLLIQAPLNILRNQALNGRKGHYCFSFFFFFLSYSPTILQRHFRVLSVNITLPYLDF